jgi:hypothetical protein
MTCIDYSDIEEWVKNELYQELLKMPLWTASAFEKDGQFYCDEIRTRLLTKLIASWVTKYPYFNDDVGRYIYDFKTEAYMPLVRQVWGISYDNYGPMSIT